MILRIKSNIWSQKIKFDLNRSKLIWSCDFDPADQIWFFCIKMWFFPQDQIRIKFRDQIWFFGSDQDQISGSIWFFGSNNHLILRIRSGSNFRTKLESNPVSVKTNQLCYLKGQIISLKIFFLFRLKCFFICAFFFHFFAFKAHFPYIYLSINEYLKINLIKLFLKLDI